MTNELLFEFDMKMAFAKRFTNEMGVDLGETP